MSRRDPEAAPWFRVAITIILLITAYLVADGVDLAADRYEEVRHATAP